MKQLDNFTPIHNDVLENLVKITMSSYEWQVIFTIFRKTYGFTDNNGERKKIDWISNSQISEMTGIAKAHISRTIKKLIIRKLITKTGNKIGLNKEGLKLPKQVTNSYPNGQLIVTQTGNSELPKQAQGVAQTGISIPFIITKETITKEIKKRETNLINPETINRKYLKLSEILIKDISEHWKFNDGKHSGMITIISYTIDKIIELKQIDLFTKTFYHYREYMKEQDYKHNLITYLGTEEQGYQNGAWYQKNWIEELKFFDKQKYIDINKLLKKIQKNAELSK